MWKTHLLAVAAVALMMAGWAGVQLAWRRVIAPDCSDPDVLAGRGSCRGARCGGECRKRGAARAHDEEARR